MTDTNSLLGTLMTFASLMAGISIAVERVVEMIKGAIPALNNAWKTNDQVRAAIVQLIAAAVGAVIAALMPNQVKAALPQGINTSLTWSTYAVLGLIASGGSGAWNHVLDILAAIKTQKTNLANLIPAPAAAGSAAAPPATAPAQASAAQAGAPTK
jgi:hypothetical protein